MDERLIKIEQEKQNALNQSNSLYGSLLKDNENLYTEQKNYAAQQEQIQNNLLNQQLNLQQQNIDNQKKIAQENYQTESKRAKNNYTSFINPYGVQAESQASNGLLNSGLSETTKLGGWHTYQNRIANANKALQDALVAYDNEMNDARVNYDVQKAQNALAKLEMMLNYSQNFYDNKTNISQSQLSAKQNIDDNYFNRYQTEYGNIQNEKAQAEAIRQYNEQMAQKQAQLAWEKEQYNRNMAWQQEQARIAQEQWQKDYELSKYNAYKQTQQNSYIDLIDETGPTPEQNEITDNVVYEAFYSPHLSTSEARKWHASTFQDFKLTKNELLEKIAQGKSNGIINDSDIEKIMKAYGVS